MAAQAKMQLFTHLHEEQDRKERQTPLLFIHFRSQFGNDKVTLY